MERNKTQRDRLIGLGCGLETARQEALCALRFDPDPELTKALRGIVNDIARIKRDLIMAEMISDRG